MAVSAGADDRRDQPRALELWMISNIAAGAATASFVTLLIPPFVTQVTGSAVRAGVVLAIIGLAAVVGPFVGGLADRTGTHRQLYLAGLIGIAVSFVLLAADARSERYGPLVGILLGVSIAAQGTIGAAFIVGARLPDRVVASQLTTYSVLYPVGQAVGGVVVSAGHLLDLTYRGQFWLAAAVLAVFVLITWFGINTPARRLHLVTETGATPDAVSNKPPKLPMRRVLLSTFGIFLAVAGIGSIANNGLSSQIANVMPEVYGFSATQTSGLMGLAGLLSIGVILLAGWWMRRSGALAVYSGGTVVKWAGMLSMAMVGALSGQHLLLAALAMQVTLQGPQLTRMSASAVSKEMAPVQATEANGYNVAANALGAFVGSLLAGALADGVGFNAVNWMAAIFGGVALLLLVAVALPRQRVAVTHQRAGS